MIPKILHFTWKSEEDLKNRFINLDSGARMSLLECVNTFREKNPNWEYRFYPDTVIDMVVRGCYPLFYPTFKSLKIIEQVDLFRYMCLYQFGGVFLDTDCVCNKPLDEFLGEFPEAKLIAAEEFHHNSNWVNYPPHKQLNLWAIFATKENHHIRNILAQSVGNCLIKPDMPVIEKTSMASFGDYVYKAAALDKTVRIVSSSYLGLDGRLSYLHGEYAFGYDNLPSYILHGYHGSWIDQDFKAYAELMNKRDSELEFNGGLV